MFEVAEYKKPEYKERCSGSAFVPAGTKSKFDINARYFFGAPVANAEVKYYIYCSRYYPPTTLMGSRKNRKTKTMRKSTRNTETITATCSHKAKASSTRRAASKSSSTFRNPIRTTSGTFNTGSKRR